MCAVLHKNNLLTLYTDGAGVFNKVGSCQVLDCLFVCFIALRPKSTAMVMAGRSLHLTTLFPGQA